MSGDPYLTPAHRAMINEAATPAPGGAVTPPATDARLGTVVLSQPPADVAAPVVVEGSDPRLSDPRPPLAHTHPQSEITGLPAALSGKVDSTDVRLTDARTPKPHMHSTSEVTGLDTALTGKVDTSDPRLTNARAPTAHTHVVADITNLSSDPVAGTAGLRTLGTGAQQALPGSYNDNGVYRTILDVTGGLAAAAAAGTRGFGHGALILTATAVTTPLDLIYLNPADYAVTGLTARLRVKAQLVTNATAPTGTWTFGLHPVTAVAGASGGVSYTIGAAVSGSTVAFATPAASSLNQNVAADFGFPAAGYYALGLVTSAAVATSSYVHVSAFLQMRST